MYILVFIFGLDILKIGGPYTRLTFLNASTVNRIEKDFYFRSIDCFRVIVMRIGMIFNDGMIKNYIQMQI